MKESILKIAILFIAPIIISNSYADIQEPLPPSDDDQVQCVEPGSEPDGQLYNIFVSGVDQITTAIMANTPSTLQGQVFDVEVRGREEYNLTLFPKSAFKITDYYSNYFQVEVVNSDALYVREGGIFFPRYESIKYRVSLANALPIPQCTDSFQKCLISVSFLYNRQLLDFERIAQAFDYKFIYDEDALELVRVAGSEVQFRRKNNDYAVVKVELLSRSTQRVIKIESEPLALCKQISDDDDSDPDHGGGHGDGHGDGHGGGHGDGHGDGHGGGHGDGYGDGHGDGHPRPTPPRPEIDHEWMRFKSTQIDILNRDDRLLSRGFTVYYRLMVTNPYPSDIECTVTLVSSRGVNRKYEIIDTQVHKNFYIPAKTTADEDGSIEGKEGHGTNGLLWTTNYGHEIKATGCRYVD